MDDFGSPIRIAIDAMGGDTAPFSVVAGAVMGYRVLQPEVEIILVGDEAKIRNELKGLGAENLPIKIVDAPESIDMSDSPVEAVKQKKHSSINVGLQLHKDGKADAFISAGNTGAVMTAALFTLGRLKGVSRPGIASLIPTEEGIALIIDVGANSECKAPHLYQFGVMGSIYSKYILKVKNPKVGLLSIGEENTKGTEVTIASHKLLDSSGLNFCGNVEGRDILRGTADVVVCDGFVGNILLKFAESTGSFFSKLLKRKIRGNLLATIGAVLMFAAFKSFRQSLDSAEYGGAPLLGVNGVCIICHGNSSPRAIKNAIIVAVDVVRKEVNKVIQEKIVSSGYMEDSTAAKTEKLL